MLGSVFKSITNLKPICWADWVLFWRLQVGPGVGGGESVSKLSGCWPYPFPCGWSSGPHSPVGCQPRAALSSSLRGPHPQFTTWFLLLLGQEELVFLTSSSKTSQRGKNLSTFKGFMWLIRSHPPRLAPFLEIDMGSSWYLQNIFKTRSRLVFEYLGTTCMPGVGVLSP